MPLPRILSTLAGTAALLGAISSSSAHGLAETQPSTTAESKAPASPANATPFAHAIPAVAAPAPEGFYLVEDAPAVGQAALSYRAMSTDKGFRELVSRWGRETGWSVAWELDSDYSFSYASDFGQDFYRAVDGVCASLNSLGIRAKALAYPENKVLRIVLEGTPR